MRKFLFFFLLLLASFSYPNDEKVRKTFLSHYYEGEYQKAHALLSTAFARPLTRQIWDERIHLSDEKISCTGRAEASPSAIALARLRIGRIEEAASSFGEDWLSFLGKATYSLWKCDFPAVDENIKAMLRLAPEEPEALYFTALASSAPESQIEYFKKYISLEADEPIKKKIAQYSIEFLEKTRGLPLNQVAVPSNPQIIDFQLANGMPVIKVRINDKNSTLLVDTGAGGLSVKEKGWQPKVSTDLVMFGLGKQDTVSGSRVVFDEMSVGDVKVTNPVAAVSQSLSNSMVDGVLGTILFSNHMIFLPLKSDKNFILFQPGEEDPVRFLEKNGVKFSRKFTMPFYLVSRLMILKGRIKKSGEDMDILLDTGAQNSLISMSAAKKYTHINYVLSRQIGRQSGVVGLAGKAEESLISENVDIQIGESKREFKYITALNLAQISESLELEVDAILGRDFLREYALLIDYRKNQVTFLK